MNHVISSLLVVVGLINFLPVIAVVSADRISQAYAIPVEEPNLEILLRHRALLFGVLGGYILYAAFKPGLQASAMVLAAISMLGYLYLCWSVGGHNPNLHRVLLIDILGLVCLAAAASLKFFSGRL